MSLSSLLTTTQVRSKNLLKLVDDDFDDSVVNFKEEITEARLDECMDNLREQISFFRAYPDIFVDMIKGPDCKFKFYYYQRLVLRACMRHRKTYFVFSRGFSKSFLSMMSLVLKAVLYPNSELFITTGGKQQAASISIAKIDEICKLIPALNNEINWERGKTKHSKDDVKYIFKNGSVIDILPALESSRGQRRTGKNENFLSTLRAKVINKLSFILIYFINIKIFLEKENYYDRLYLSHY